MTWNLGSDHELDIIKKNSEFPRLPYLSYSDDDGLTWSEPVNMDETCRNMDWGWYATGPGFGIQIKQGKYKGRLVMLFSQGPWSDMKVYAVYSNDQGESWNRGKTATCLIFGMPNEAIKHGAVDKILPLDASQHNRPRSLSVDQYYTQPSVGTGVYPPSSRSFGSVRIVGGVWSGESLGKTISSNVGPK